MAMISKPFPRDTLPPAIWPDAGLIVHSIAVAAATEECSTDCNAVHFWQYINVSSYRYHSKPGCLQKLEQ